MAHSRVWKTCKCTHAFFLGSRVLDFHYSLRVICNPEQVPYSKGNALLLGHGWELSFLDQQHQHCLGIC